MKTIHKEPYETPSILIFEVLQEGVICTSGGTEQFGNGNNYDELFFN